MYTGKVLVAYEDKRVENPVMNFLSDCLLLGDFEKKGHSKSIAGDLNIDFDHDKLVSPNKDQVKHLLRGVRTEMESKFQFFNLTDLSHIKLLEYSKYADLFISTYSTFYDLVHPIFGQDSEENTNQVNCPVVVIPENYTGIKNIVLLHNGSDESLFIIKTFCNVFSELIREVDVTLLNFVDENKVDYTDSFVQLKWLVSYLKLHCGSIAVHHFKDEDPDYLKKLLGLNPSTLLVQGSRPLNNYALQLFDGVPTLEIRSTI